MRERIRDARPPPCAVSLLGRWTLRLIVIALGFGTLAACSDGPSSPGDWEAYVVPDFIGVVSWTDGRRPTEVTPSRIMLIDVVRPRSFNPFMRDTIGLTIWPSTVIFIRYPDSSLVRADTAYPAVADTVQAWHTGLELRSDPPQYYATRLEIFRDFS
jgi:hypothetical protein